MKEKKAERRNSDQHAGAASGSARCLRRRHEHYWISLFRARGLEIAPTLERSPGAADRIMRLAQCVSFDLGSAQEASSTLIPG